MPAKAYWDDPGRSGWRDHHAWVPGYDRLVVRPGYRYGYGYSYAHPGVRYGYGRPLVAVRPPKVVIRP